MGSSPVAVTLLFRTKNYSSHTVLVPSDVCEFTPLLWLMTYVNHILDNNACVINKKYVPFFFNFYFSFHCYKYPNWSTRHGEMILLFLYLRCSLCLCLRPSTVKASSVEAGMPWNRSTMLCWRRWISLPVPFIDTLECRT